MSNVFVTIKICYVHNQWYGISCATLYLALFDGLCVMYIGSSLIFRHIIYNPALGSLIYSALDCYFMILWFLRNLFGLPVTFVFGFNTWR